MNESRFELFDGLIASAGKTLQRIKTNKMEKYGLAAPIPHACASWERQGALV